MKTTTRSPEGQALPAARALVLGLLLLVGSALWAQTCYTAGDLDPATSNAVQQAAQRLFDMSASGDYASLRAAAVSSLASNFGAIETAAAQSRPNLQGARATIRSYYVLDNPGNAPSTRSEFYCGVYNSPDRVAFVINNLAPGRYAVVVEDVTGGKAPMTMSVVLQQEGGVWKLAGYYLRPNDVNGHDGNWFLAQARQFKAQGDNHSAWFYYLAAWRLLAPVDFMSTAALDKVAGEMEQSRPSDLPTPGVPMPISVNGQTFNITDMSADPAKDGLELTIRYQAPNVSDVETTRNLNLSVGRALVAKYPGFRQAFTQIVAYAIDPQGRAFWTPLPLK